jgi:hypothetical protein
MRRFGRSLVLIAALLLSGACAVPSSDLQQGPYPESTPDEITTRLKQGFELMERHGVLVLVDREDCRLIEYRNGTFSPHSAKWCFDYARAAEPEPFIERATDDFNQLVSSLDVGRARFSEVIEVGYSSDGKLTRATFKFVYNFGTELLVFDPGYRLPADEAGERWHQVVNADWYLEKVDWN